MTQKQGERKKLLELSTQIATTLDVKKVINLLGHGLHSLIQYDMMAIYEANLETQKLVPISIEGAQWNSMEANSEAWSIPFGKGILGDVMKTLKGELVNNAHADLRSIYPINKTIPLEHVIAIPLSLGNQCWGAFAMNRLSNQTFNEDEFETAQFLASYASMALNNIKLIGEIKENQAIKQVIFDTISDAIITVNDKGNIIFCNEAMQKVLGYSSAELLNKSFLTIIPESLREVNKKIFFDYLNSGIRKFQSWSAIQMTGLHKSGNRVPLEISFGETTINGQKVLSAAMRDITERKRSEETIKSTTTRLANLIGTLQAGILVEDEYRKIVLTNNSFCNLFEIPAAPENLTGLDCSNAAEQSKELFADPEKFVQRISELLKLRQIVSNEEVIMKNGKTLSRDYVPIFVDNNYRGHMWLYRDITFSKNIEQDLINAKDLAEEAVKAKQNFLATMSHELRTPINGVLGLTNLMASTNQTKENQEYLKGIKTSGEHLLAIINDILDLAKIEAGKMKLQRVDFNPTELIKGVIHSQKPLAAEKDLKIILSCDERIPNSLIGDPVRLNQILYNLISNAIKFTKKGEVNIHTTVLSMNAQEVLLELVVADTGIGIEPTKLEKIFESFTQADRTIAANFGGSGLGLSIVKQLMDLMRGKIDVTSQLGKGSRFRITLPLKVNNHPQEKTIAPSLSELAMFNGARILLAEDNLINQTVAKRTLEKWGIEVDIANNGLEAIARLGSHNYDMIIMDIQMPELDGYETTLKIRNELPSPICNIPILAMTASVLDAIERTHAVGMNDYISKPFNYTELNDKLKLFLTPKSVTEKQLATGKTNRSYIDFNYLETISPGNIEFQEEMINLFTSQSDVYMTDIKNAFIDGNYSALKLSAHAFKPMGSYIGIHSLTELVSRLEKLAAAGRDIDSMAGLIAQITIILDAVKVEIQWLKENTFKKQ